MSPFDISVFMFFAVMLIKIVNDTISFWKEAEEEVQVTTPRINPKHIPAPSRPSPKHLNPAPRSNNRPNAVPAKIEPIRQPNKRTVRPAVVASTAYGPQAIRPVSAPIKRTNNSNAPRRTTTVA